MSTRPDVRFEDLHRIGKPLRRVRHIPEFPQFLFLPQHVAVHGTRVIRVSFRTGRTLTEGRRRLWCALARASRPSLVRPPRGWNSPTGGTQCACRQVGLC